MPSPRIYRFGSMAEEEENPSHRSEEPEDYTCHNPLMQSLCQEEPPSPTARSEEFDEERTFQEPIEPAPKVETNLKGAVRRTRRPRDRKESRKQPNMQPLQKKSQEITNCIHTNAMFYAKGMCKNCYHLKGREKRAYACPHSDRVSYAKGICKNCYLAAYHKERRAKKKEASAGLPLKRVKREQLTPVGERVKRRRGRPRTISEELADITKHVFPKTSTPETVDVARCDSHTRH